jgi:hypothetical protein
MNPLILLAVLFTLFVVCTGGFVVAELLNSKLWARVFACSIGVLLALLILGAVIAVWAAALA